MFILFLMVVHVVFVMAFLFLIFYPYESLRLRVFLWIVFVIVFVVFYIGMFKGWYLSIF